MTRAVEPLSRIAGEGGKRSEPGEGLAGCLSSPSRCFATGPSLSRDAGEGLQGAR